ncbi:Fanconi anemia group J protein isoform X2 [Punica granatum]|uniref:DNA 5'-3' helicase FANCJ n=1 Tax=Punica granatum TaxID=22663 RepID=A0A6P8D4E2_PUNGR|nr:Fanconi anemia group J protein isoform X2 [Punica granatum]
MVSANPPKNPKAKLHTDPSKSANNVFHIGGTPVEFPYQPYGTQLAFMGRVISTLDRAQRDGHCHALLESPTGTGKSLSLLCSTLAWQQNYKLKSRNVNPSQLKPAPEAFTDPLNYGGGFVPEVEPSGQGNAESVQPPAESNSKAKKKLAPTIFYSSRTHSQISQVIREYRKTAYRVPMAVLASRKHYCTNPQLRGRENLDEECKLLLRNRDVGCSEFKNANKVKAHPSLQKGGCHEAHDIEDLVKVGQVVRGCSYYAARSMADDAQLVFCPYSYVVNPVIRGAMDVDIKGAILIFDEAHNIEDIAREAGSVDIEEDVLQKLHSELEELCPINALIYQPLCEVTQDLISWMERRKSTLEKREFQHYVSCWTGDKAIKELQEAHISQQCFPILLECATKAIKAATDLELETPHLSGMSVITLEGLFSSLTYFFCRNGSHILDYQLALQRYIKRDARTGLGYPIHCLSLWCLNPAVVFKDITDLSLSVILTSGTLSPMNSFSSELGVQFGTCLEAPHVIDVKSQVWAGIISTGPGNYSLNSSYKTADGYAFQDALGRSLEEILKIVPGGSLIFFPSYKLMEKLCKRWRETGQWSQLGALKSLFLEPRGGNQDDFEPVLKGYCDAVRRGSKPVVPRKKKLKKQDLSQSNKVNSTEELKKEGAAFLAVCRGKVSEGIDFSDNNARAVIVVGIPFPNVNDIQVGLKKKYNDTYKSSKNLLSGSEWYCQQAFRALNQAVGRCIRHMDDYGAIILLDERYREERNRAYISKWIRNSIQLYDDFDISVEGLKSFFRDVKERVQISKADQSDCCTVKEETVACPKNSRVLPRKKNQNINKLVHNSEKVVSCSENLHFAQLKSQSGLEAQVGLQASAMKNKSCKDYIDLDNDFENSSRPTAYLSSPFQEEDTDICIFKETPFSNSSITSPSSGSLFKDNSGSTIVHDSEEFPDQLLSPQSMSLNAPGLTPSMAQCSTVTTTPEREAPANSSILKPETELFLNSSVNSHTQKRRRLMTSAMVVDDEDGHPMVYRDSNRRIEFDAANCFSKSSEKTDIPLHRMESNFALPEPSSAMDERLRISCSLCRSSLGLPQNNLLVTGSLSSSSKVHLASLLEGKPKPSQVNVSTSIPVIVSEISSVDPQIYRSAPAGNPEGGTWSEEDGCVFKTIFCPFCVSPGNCLGVQIMATDSSNTHLLNKILFYADHLDIKNSAALEDSSLKEKHSVPVSDQGTDALKAIERFSYTAKRDQSAEATKGSRAF